MCVLADAEDNSRARRISDVEATAALATPDVSGEDDIKQQKRLAQKGGAMRRMSMVGGGAGRGGHRNSRGQSIGRMISYLIKLCSILIIGSELEGGHVAEASAAMAQAHLAIEPDEKETELHASTTATSTDKTKPTGASSIFGIFKKSESTTSQDQQTLGVPSEVQQEEFSFSNDQAGKLAASAEEQSGADNRAKQVLQVSKPAMRRVSMAGRGGVDRRASRDRRDSNASTISEIGEGKEIDEETSK